MNIEQVLSYVANILQVGGTMFAILAWLQARKTNNDLAKERNRLAEKVSLSLVLKSSKERKTLPLNIARGDITRAEVLGRLGMLPMKEKEKRFSLAWLSRQEFSDLLYEVRSGMSKEIVILCSDEEFNQFDL